MANLIEDLKIENMIENGGEAIPGNEGEHKLLSALELAKLANAGNIALPMVDDKHYMDEYMNAVAGVCFSKKCKDKRDDKRDVKTDSKKANTEEQRKRLDDDLKNSELNRDIQKKALEQATTQTSVGGSTNATATPKVPLIIGGVVVGLLAVGVTLYFTVFKK